MKATGIIRKIDSLGRIVIPKELRTIYDFKEYDPIEIFIDEDVIMLKKYNKSCVLCQEEEDLINFNDKKICLKCLKVIKAIK